MTQISSEVLIRAPVHEVFAFASDWRRWAEWFAGTSDFRPVTARTHGTGARYAYRARLLGVRVPIETEIRDFVEDGGWTGVGRGGPENRTHWRFVAEGDATRFTFGMEYRIPLLPDFLDRLLVRPLWQRSADESTRNLKQRLEAGRAPQPAEGAVPAMPPSA